MMPMPQPQQAPPGMFAQMAQQPPTQGGMPPGAPPMQGGGQPPMQGGAPQQGPPPMDPRVILQMIQTLPPQLQQMLAQQVMQSAAKQGRGGDTMIAHLTPGEKTVPPEIQTPKVLATLNKAYKEKGVQPQQFTAGAPQSSKNPSTGLPEYNFMSAFAPVALGGIAALAAPELLPLLGVAGDSALGASALGGLGSAAGGLATGQTPTQAALSGIGSAAGGYALGSLTGAAGSASGELSQADKVALLSKGVTPSQAASYGLNVGGQGASQAANYGVSGGMSAMPSTLPSTAGAPAGMSLFGQKINPLAMAGSTVGGYLGGQLGATPKSNPPNLPPGFNTNMDPVGSKGSAQQQLGMNNSTQPLPSFNGFNPATNYPGAYNFYPNRT